MITSFSNEKKAKLYGVELNVQHMFGNSGFGVQANYTYVKSDLQFDNASKGNQFALVGLSDSANLIGIYEDAKWSVRAAYNWRDRFLSSVTDQVGPNPQYVEPYGTAVGQVFLAVAVFLLNVVLSRQIGVQRGQIAALKALGYSNWSLGWHYLKWALAIGLAGVLLGIAGAFVGGMIGTWLGWGRVTQGTFDLASVAIATSSASAPASCAIPSPERSWARAYGRGAAAATGSSSSCR